jgi:hypothetical protein
LSFEVNLAPSFCDDCGYGFRTCHLRGNPE